MPWGKPPDPQFLPTDEHVSQIFDDICAFRRLKQLQPQLSRANSEEVTAHVGLQDKDLSRGGDGCTEAGLECVVRRTAGKCVIPVVECLLGTGTDKFARR